MSSSSERAVASSPTAIDVVNNFIIGATLMCPAHQRGPIDYLYVYYGRGGGSK